MQTEKGSDLNLSARLLKRGKLVAIPTETVYGLAANGFDAAAIAGIFEAKGRPHFDPLILHIGKIEQINQLARSFPENARKLTEKFWPGPVTIVLPKADIIPDIATSGLDTVGIRMPDHPLTLELLKSIDFPLAAPSANPFGYISPTTARHVLDQLNGKIDYILDGGNCKVGIESTIVTFDGNAIIVLRQGGTSIKEIEAVAGPVVLAGPGTSNPLAPGMLISHYAPRTPLILGDIDELIAENRPKNFGVLGFTSTNGHPGIALSKKGDSKEAAQNLFSALRSLDKAGYDLIIAALIPAEGLGAAINDRLTRAQWR